MREKIADIIRKPQMMYHPQIGLNFATHSKEGAETIAKEILKMQCKEIEKVRKNNPYPEKPSLASAEYYEANGYDRACRKILAIFKEV